MRSGFFVFWTWARSRWDSSQDMKLPLGRGNTLAALFCCIKIQCMSALSHALHSSCVSTYPRSDEPWPDPLSGVWRASESSRSVRSVCPTGFDLLDACLPGGGWPCAALIEVWQPPGAHQEWQLLCPALGAWQRRRGSMGAGPPRAGVVLVSPPHPPLMPALQSSGLQVDALVCVNAADPWQRLWACEQALQTPAVGAVIAWLPHLPMVALRRLQHMANLHGGLLWVFNPELAQPLATPSVLRLNLKASAQVGTLTVRVLKRRGPPLTQDLTLISPNHGLMAALAASRWRQALRRSGASTSETCWGSAHAAAKALAGSEAHA